MSSNQFLNAILTHPHNHINLDGMSQWITRFMSRFKGRSSLYFSIIDGLDSFVVDMEHSAQIGEE